MNIENVHPKKCNICLWCHQTWLAEKNAINTEVHSWKHRQIWDFPASPWDMGQLKRSQGHGSQAKCAEQMSLGIPPAGLRNSADLLCEPFASGIWRDALGGWRFNPLKGDATTKALRVNCHPLV